MDPHCYVETWHLCAPLLTSVGHQKGTGTSCGGAGAESPAAGLQEGRYGAGLGAHSKWLGCGSGASAPLVLQKEVPQAHACIHIPQAQPVQPLAARAKITSMIILGGLVGAGLWP